MSDLSQPAALRRLIDESGGAFAVVRRREQYEHLWRDEIDCPEWVSLEESGESNATRSTKMVPDTA